MVITFVSEVSGDLAAGGGPTTVSLPSGLQEGDVVVSILASDGGLAGRGIQGQSWTEILNTSFGPGAQSSYKVMGATPDTTVDITHASTRKIVYLIQAFRGVDITNVEDATVTSASGGTTITPADITTITDGALVIVCATLDDDEATLTLFSSGYTNIIEDNTNGAGAGSGATAAMGSKIIATAATESPGEVDFSSTDDWTTYTIALRPIIATGTNLQINIGDVWKEVPAVQINIGDDWKEVAGMQINIGDTWRTIF